MTNEPKTPMNSIYISDQGELLLIDAPERPSQYESYSGIVDTRSTKQLNEYYQYEAALASAIASAVRFKDDVPVVELILNVDHADKKAVESWLKNNKGQTFPLPTGYQTELHNQYFDSGEWRDCKHGITYGMFHPDKLRQVAILSKLEEEKTGVPKSRNRPEPPVVAPSEEVKQGFTDKQRIDWLEKMMTPDDRFCEIYFAGLRDFKTGRASSFQIESNPDIIKYQQAPTLREAIDLAIKNEKV